MSFFTSLTGLNAATAQLGVTSNNIANASTVGFKRSRADFGDIFATSPLQKATSTIGQGVSLKKVTQEFGQGNMNFSSNTLDLAISGDGFFPLKSADGFQDIFTRNGTFMMNDQYNVVNSAGQRLMAASVDSTGKANLNDLNVLTIPQKTTGLAKETSLVQLGLNFPADAQVVTKAFNRNDPASYNKSTALTVYDRGGNGYLATVYYAKTQNASQADPNNKWQTYVYVGDTLVAAALQQATSTTGEKLYVNKYGKLKPESEVGDLLVNAKTQKFSLNQLTDQRTSEPATVTGGLAPHLSTLEGIDFKNLPASQLSNLFSIDVDNTGVPVKVGLEHLAGKDLKLSGAEIAKELTNVLNRKFGDERFFNFAGQQNFLLTVTNTDGTLTENKTIQLDALDMNYEQVIDKINSQLNGASDVLSNVSFSSNPLPSEFKGYKLSIGGKTLSGSLVLPKTLSTKPMEDLAATMQARIQIDLVARLGYTTEAASKVTVNIQNGNEVRVSDASGQTISDLVLSTESIGSPVSQLTNFEIAAISTGPAGIYTNVNLQIGSTTIAGLDISKLDTVSVDSFAKDLKNAIQTELSTQGWTKFEVSQIDIKANAAGTGLSILNSGGHQITKFSLSKDGGLTYPDAGALVGSTATIDNVIFADTPFKDESLLQHFSSMKVETSNSSGVAQTPILIDFKNADATTFPNSFNNFSPNDEDPVIALASMDNLAKDIEAKLNGSGNLPVGSIMAVKWIPDTKSFQVKDSTGKAFINDIQLNLNTTDVRFNNKIVKGNATKIVPAVRDVNKAVVTPSSIILSNVGFPQGVKAVGDEFASFNVNIAGKAYTGPLFDPPALSLSSIPMNDLVTAIQSRIRAAMVTGGSTVERSNQISVSVINGKDIKISDAGGEDITEFSLTSTAGRNPNLGSANYSLQPLADGVKASYDPVTQQFSFAPVNLGNTVTLSGVNDQLGLTTPVTQVPGSDALVTSGAPSITNNYIRPVKLQRFGLKVEYDTVNEKFVFKSGTTGDYSSISITKPSTFANERLGLANDGTYVVKTSPIALRGIPSEPAIMIGSPMGINANNNFSVNLTNNKFVVSVDDVKGTVYLEPKETYTIDSFVQALQNGINRLSGPPDQAGLTGSTVSGVKVTYDINTNRIKFTTGTATSNSFIKVSGDAQWGLANVAGGRGSTSTWIKPTQYTQVVNGVPVAQYIDEFGKETFSPDGFKSLPEWSPIFLEKGELTFDTGGNLVSPKQGSQLDTVYLPDGKGALTININYSKSTQFSSPYAVLSQSQDGAPEGDLVGLSVADDGLVNASYSNGAQKSLGKVVLVNFSNPTGLRQIGDTNYYKSSSSGSAKYGEAGSAGFGTIRSGATERANVDLTQELVDLITEQRNFQANAKAIETSTTLTQAIIQIRA